MSEQQFQDGLSRHPNDVDYREVFADWLESHGREHESQWMRHRAAMMALPTDSVAYRLRDQAVRSLKPRVDEAWIQSPAADDWSSAELLSFRFIPRWSDAPASEPHAILSITESVHACFEVAHLDGAQSEVTQERLFRWGVPFEYVASNTDLDLDFLFRRANHSGPSSQTIYEARHDGWIDALFAHPESLRASTDESGQIVWLEDSLLAMVVTQNLLFLTPSSEPQIQALLLDLVDQELDGGSPLTRRPLRAASPGGWQYLADADNPAAGMWQSRFGDEPPPIHRKFRSWDKLIPESEAAAAQGLVHRCQPRSHVEILDLDGDDQVRLGLGAVPHFPFLTHLSFQDASIHPESLRHILTESDSRLTSLSFLNCVIGVECLAMLHRLPRLKRLSFRRTPLNAKGLQALSHCRQMVELFVEEAEIRDDGVRHLAGSRLEFLTLDTCHITDDGLADLSEITSLRYLSLEGNSIGDRGVYQLQKLHALTHLGLAFTTITEDVVYALASMKSLQVISGLPSSAAVFLMDELPGFTAPQRLAHG